MENASSLGHRVTELEHQLTTLTAILGVLNSLVAGLANVLAGEPELDIALYRERFDLLEGDIRRVLKELIGEDTPE